MSAKEFTPEELDGRTRLSAEMHAREVARRHGISVKDLLGKARNPHLQAARVELYRALRQQGWSFPSIGQFAGGRDHTTIIAAISPIEKKRAKAAAQKIRDS